MTDNDRVLALLVLTGAMGWAGYYLLIWAGTPVPPESLALVSTVIGGALGYVTGAGQQVRNTDTKQDTNTHVPMTGPDQQVPATPPVDPAIVARIVKAQNRDNG